MALVLITVRTLKSVMALIVSPWSAVKYVEHALLWSVPLAPEPVGPQWADDLFTKAKATRMLLRSSSLVDDGDLTDSCSSSSGFDGYEDSDEWSSDDDGVDAYVAKRQRRPSTFQSHRWYWSSCVSDITANGKAVGSSTASSSRVVEPEEVQAQEDAELSALCALTTRRLTVYAMPSMPSMDPSAGEVVAAWVDRHGSSAAQFAYVADPPTCVFDLSSQDLSAQQYQLPASSVVGYYIAVL